MKKGFALLMVMVILVLMGAEMFILTGGANKITFQSNHAFLEAVRQNLISSGLNWAEYNVENKNVKEMKDKIWLDTAQIGTRESRLGTAVENIRHEQALVIIDTVCGRGRENLRHNAKHRILLNRR